MLIWKSLKHKMFSQVQMFSSYSCPKHWIVLTQIRLDFLGFSPVSFLDLFLLEYDLLFLPQDLATCSELLFQ